MVLHLDQNKGPETYQKKFIRVAPNSIFGASWILVTPNIIFQGIVFDVKKWRKVLARRKLSDSFQSGSNREDFQRTLALI